ncbi:hypothetical protein AB0L97_26795, partial [Nocardia sp. NPDC051911]
TISNHIPQFYRNTQHPNTIDTRPSSKVGQSQFLVVPSPQALTTVLAAATRAEFRYVVIARPEDTTHLDRIEGITVVTPTDLRGVLSWLESLPSDRSAPTPASLESPGMRIAHNLGPGRVRGMRAALNGSGSDDPPVTSCGHADQNGPHIEFITDNS